MIKQAAIDNQNCDDRAYLFFFQIFVATLCNIHINCLLLTVRGTSIDLVIRFLRS